MTAAGLDVSGIYIGVGMHIDLCCTAAREDLHVFLDRVRHDLDKIGTVRTEDIDMMMTLLHDD